MFVNFLRGTNVKAALIVDVRGVYNMIFREYHGRTLAYEKLVQSLEQNENLYFMHKVAYIMQSETANVAAAQKFINFLRYSGFEVHSGPHNWNTAMALKAAEVLPSVDALCLVTNHIEHGRILHYAKTQGKFTFAVGKNFPPQFKNEAKLIDIPIDLTMVKNGTEQQLELPSESSKPASDDLPAKSDS
jgi:hypothetical protein